MKTLVMTILAGCLLSSCMNAVTYHHSERLSIATVESKAADVQQPVQGNIGLKYRTILVAPGKKQSTAGVTTDLGESTSVVSDFNLVRKPNGMSSTTTITSAFMTGAAAEAAPASSAAAISGVGYDGPSDVAVDRAALLRNILKSLKTLQGEGDKSAERHIKDLDHLAGAMKDLTSGISSREYYDLSGTTVTDNTGPASQFDFATKTPTFLDAVNYENMLRGQIARIQSIESNWRTYQYQRNGTTNPVTLTDLAVFLKRKKEIQEEHRQFFNRIGSSYLIDNATSYVTARL